jgi:hypothetical protein
VVILPVDLSSLAWVADYLEEYDSLSWIWRRSPVVRMAVRLRPGGVRLAVPRGVIPERRRATAQTATVRALSGPSTVAFVPPWAADRPAGVSLTSEVELVVSSASGA